VLALATALLSFIKATSKKMSRVEQRKKKAQKEAIDAAMDAFLRASFSGDHPDLGSIVFEHAATGPVCVVDNFKAYIIVTGSVHSSILPVLVRCKHCGGCPCILNVNDNYDTLMELGSALEEEGGKTNREIRFKLYQEAARLCFGKLGQGVRKKLPNCVTGEIHDAYPEKEGKYVGFRETDVEVECKK